MKSKKSYCASCKKKMSKRTAKNDKALRGREKIATVMEEYKEGKLRSGSKKGPKVKSQKQALAIAFSEAKKAKKKKKK